MKFYDVDVSEIDIDDDKVLEALKEDFGIDDIFDEDEIIKHIKKNYVPDKVFMESDLDDWATENGYIKAEDE